MCVIPPTSTPRIMRCIYLIGLLLHAQSRHPVILRLHLISHEDIQGIFTPLFPQIQLLYALIATIIKVSIQFEKCVFHLCYNGQPVSTL